MTKKGFLKKILLIFILVFVTLITAACDFTNINGGNSGGYTPTVPSPGGSNTRPSTPKEEKPKDDFPEIPVHKQTKNPTDAEILGSDFFSSKEDYFRVGASGRYVNLKNHKKVFIRYEENLEYEVKKELDNVIVYLQNIFNANGYELVYDKGNPLPLDIFVTDTIYIRNPTKDVLKEFEERGAGGLTYLKTGASPRIYINKNVNDVIIDGKNIKLARIILHEIMHGFGFRHTAEINDAMAALMMHIGKYYSSYYYFAPDTRYKIFIDDYLFFSNSELAAIVQYLNADKSYSEQLSLYKSIGGTIPDLDFMFDGMKSNFESYTRNQKVSEKSRDVLLENQIVSMKDKTNRYEIVLNKNSIGFYSATLSDGTGFTGRSRIMNLSSNGVTNQIIGLTDFIYNGNSYNITLYAIRNKDGDFYQRWKAYDSKIDLVLADNTANYFK